MSKVDLQQMYVNRMGEMKRRMVRVETILTKFPGLGSYKTTDEDGPALEDFALQFRKVLELIAFSGMIANKAVYERAFADFVEHTYPAKISKRLASLHPTWFPEHVALAPAPSAGNSNIGFAQPVASAFNQEYWLCRPRSDYA
jgi:hypothetical protein